MKVLLDNCVWGGAKTDLSDKGHDAKWVGDFLADPGDEEIIKLAFREERILITQDKDFGELAIFRGMPHYGIVRLVGFPAKEHGAASVKSIEQYETELAHGAIITVEPLRIRVRTRS